jgi:PAT family acetyl-CoA transporter-like MFS transporter 1
LLWAPIVDSIFTRRCGLGRRKSWLIPSQLVCSALFLLLGVTSYGDALMGDAPRSWGSSLTASQPDVPLLTLVFFILYLLMATQDIAVDGWALTMLSPPYVGTASTANSVGQSLGYFAAFVGFMAAYSPEFCNTYIRTVDPNDLGANAKGIMGLSDFCTICGVMMLVTTVAVWLFKHEGRESESDMDPPLPVPSSDTTSYGDSDTSLFACFQPVVSAYRQMWQVIRLPMVLSLVFVLATCKIGYGAVDSALTLKVHIIPILCNHSLIYCNSLIVSNSYWVKV